MVNKCKTGRVSGLMFDDHGRLWGCAGETKQIVAYAPDGTKSVLAEGIAGNDLAWGAHGVYITAPQSRHVVHVAGDGKTTVVDEGIQFANGVIHSPDHSLLYVADSRGQFVYSFQCQADGTLKYKQPFFHLHLPFGQTESGADGMTVDTDGRLYVATRIGLQVCDQPGRVQFIMPDPGNGPMTNVVFGGPELDTLYITSGKQVFKRKVNVHGIPAGASPQKPPKPRL